MINDVDIEVASAKRPMRRVPTAPPIGVIIRSDDAILTELLSTRAIVIAKIVGNIMASNA